MTANKDDNSVSVLLNAGGGKFKPAVTFAAGTGPVALAAADFNHDGHVDLAVVDHGAAGVTLLMGNGKGGFTTGGTAAVAQGSTSIAVADFNNDGIPDIATVSGGFGHLDVDLGNGDGTFAPPVNYATGFCANTVVVGDFNHDGQPDLAVACTFPSNNGISILLGNPDGTFQPFKDYDAGSQTPITLAVADLNGDGVQDLVTANGQFANNSVSVLLGNGDGTFAAASVFTADQTPVAVAVGDFNGDGVPDVVAAGQGQFKLTAVGAVAVLLGNGDGSLLAAPDLVVPGPGPVVETDLTGDGIPDLAVVNTLTVSGVLLFPGLGNGSFAPPVQAVQIDQPTALAVGDFNGDHVPDLAVTTNNGVSIFLGNGDGTFGAPMTFATGPSPAWVAVADFNGDGKPDLAVADNGTGGGVSILLGNGDGTFQPASTLAAGGAASYVAVADLNRDGHPDLAVVNGSANTVSVMLGNGDGTFQAPRSYATPVGPASIGIGDFNGDHRPDLAVPTFFGGGDTIFLQAANGTFVASKSTYTTDSRPLGIAVLDLNGDGKLDLATVNDFADNVTVLSGSGAGTFTTSATYVVGDGPTWLAAGDLNGDGVPDLAVVNSNAHTVTLLETPTTAADHFRVRIVPTTTTAGAALQVTVTALDADNRLMTGYTGSVSFTSSDAAALLPAAYRFTAADHGVHRFTIALRTAGAQTATVHAGAATGAGSINVAAAAASHFQVTAAPATAGTPFDVTVTALDPFGNIDASFHGTVHFTTSDPATGTVLPQDYTFTAGDDGVHTFPGGATLLTAGLRSITITDPPTRGPSGTTAVTVQPAAASQLFVSAPASVIAGIPFAVTVTAKDPYNNVATGFTGTVHLAGTGNAVLPADYSFVPGDNGVHTFTGTVTLQTAGPQSLTVSTAGCTDGVQNGITVKPGAAAQLAILAQPANAFVATPLHPAVTVQVEDAFSNLVAAGVRVTLALAANPSGATLGGAAALTNSAGVAAFTGLTVSKPGQGYTLIAHAGTGTSSASSPFTIYAGTHFGIALPTTPIQAGTPFTITVTALDAKNHPDPSYLGTVHFGGVTLPDYPFQPADNGQQTFTVTIDRAGLQSITAADTGKSTVKGSARVTITPAALSGFLVAGFPLSAVHNVAYSFTVTAVDTYGNTIAGYLGTVQFSNTGGTALLAGPYTFTAVDKGKHTFKATLQTVGTNQSLTATDTDNPSITGTDSDINVT